MDTQNANDILDKRHAAAVLGAEKDRSPEKLSTLWKTRKNVEGCTPKPFYFPRVPLLMQCCGHRPPGDVKQNAWPMGEEGQREGAVLRR